MKEQVSIVQYPIFLKCCQYLSDPFWVYLFEDMAYGKCPYGVIIQDKTVYCILRGREFTYSLDGDKTAEEVSKELCQMLSSKLQILSQQDHFRFRSECQLHTKHYMESIHSWNDIRKKNLKDILLEKFSLSQQSKHAYSNQLTRTLFAIIFIGLQFKTILHRQIEYDHHAIQRIAGITCEPKRFVCEYNVFLTKPSPTLPSHHALVRTAALRMSCSWKRYLLTLT